MKTDNQNRFLEWVYAVWKEVEEANDETDQDREGPRPEPMRKLCKLIGVISVGLQTVRHTKQKTVCSI